MELNQNNEDGNIWVLNQLMWLLYNFISNSIISKNKYNKDSPSLLYLFTMPLSHDHRCKGFPLCFGLDSISTSYHAQSLQIGTTICLDIFCVFDL